MKLPRWASLDNLDTLLAISIAVIVSIYAGVAGNVDIVTSSILAILGILAIGLIRDRSERSALARDLDQIIQRTERAPADQFFRSKSSEDDIIKKAAATIQMIQETGSLVTEQSQASIIDFLNRRGTLEIVVASPSNHAASHLSFRNENLPAKEAIIKRCELFLSQVRYICRKVGADSGRLTVRFSEYDPGYTSTLADGRHPSLIGRAIVRLAGFRIPFARKLDFQFNSETSPKTIAHFAEEFRVFFMSCSKFVLIQGPPRVGKTTLVERVVDASAGYAELIFSVISRELLQDGERVGFEVVAGEPRGTATGFARRKLEAHHPPNSIENYDIDIGVWDKIAADLLEAARAGKIVILDEIGEMQVSSKAFCDAVRELLADPCVTVFATISNLSHPFVDEVRAHFRTNIVELDSMNKNVVRDIVGQELESSLRSRLAMEACNERSLS